MAALVLRPLEARDRTVTGDTNRPVDGDALVESVRAAVAAVRRPTS